MAVQWENLLIHNFKNSYVKELHWRHCGAMWSIATSQLHDRSWAQVTIWVEFLCLFSQCLLGYPLGSPVSSHLTKMFQLVDWPHRECVCMVFCNGLVSRSGEIYDVCIELNQVKSWYYTPTCLLPFLFGWRLFIMWFHTPSGQVVWWCSIFQCWNSITKNFPNYFGIA